MFYDLRSKVKKWNNFSYFLKHWRCYLCEFFSEQDNKKHWQNVLYYVKIICIIKAINSFWSGKFILIATPIFYVFTIESAPSFEISPKFTRMFIIRLQRLITFIETCMNTCWCTNELQIIKLLFNDVILCNMSYLGQHFFLVWSSNDS